MNIYDKFSMGAAIRQLNEWTEAYERGQPQVSDQEWDKLYFELKEAEERLGFVFSNSPTQKILYVVLPELKKVKHEYQPMLSLDKTKDIEEIKDFIGNRKWIAMLKLDGLTCRLTYKEGKLFRAETRGDGEEGEDITHNARVLPSIPRRIPYLGELVVDGEVICTNDDFAKVADSYANSRNYAAGSIRLLDSEECANRHLTFVGWDIIKHDKIFNNLSDKLNELIDNNFIITPWFAASNFEEFENVIESLKNIADLEDYPIDGLVFKWDNCAEYMTAGRTDHHFRGGMAYKFYDEEYETTLRDIEWSMGRTGVLTPVAIYDTVNIDGADCSRASLHNINILISLLGEYPMVGQKIKVFRANQINPQISWAERAEEVLGCDPGYYLKDPDVQFLFPPKVCPVCLGETIVKESSTGTIELHCANEFCSGKLINRLDHYAGKKGLDIKHLSKATLEKLIDWGWVTKIIDLYRLEEEHRKEWINKPGFGEKSVDKLILSINESRKTDLASYIAAMGIPLIGKTYAKQLADIFETYEDFRAATTPDPICGLQPFDFTKINGFGEAMHIALTTFDYSEFDRLYDMHYIEIKNPESEPKAFNSTSQIAGKTFVITGKLKNYKNRDLLKADIEAHGGKVVGSVSSKTDFLVNNDAASTSAKNKTAIQLGVKIITEEELIQLWQ